MRRINFFFRFLPSLLPPLPPPASGGEKLKRVSPNYYAILALAVLFIFIFYEGIHDKGNDAWERGLWRRNLKNKKSFCRE